MKRLTQIALVGMILLLGISIATAQQTPQPVVRLGNFIEVGNDLFMHIIATADARYKTSHNADFEDRIRDRAIDRSITATEQHEQDGDLFYAELRFGVDFRYQKNLTFQLLFENQSVFDGRPLMIAPTKTIRAAPTCLAGRPSTENPGFRVERFWVRYKFPGTPILLHVGPDLQAVESDRDRRQ